MTDDLEKVRGIIDDRQHKLADVAVSLRPVPLRLRLIIAGIFIVGLLLVYLPSFAAMNRSNGEYVQQLSHGFSKVSRCLQVILWDMKAKEARLV